MFSVVGQWKSLAVVYSASRSEPGLVARAVMESAHPLPYDSLGFLPLSGLSRTSYRHVWVVVRPIGHDG